MFIVIRVYLFIFFLNQIPHLREPRSLYALNKELGPQQAARWWVHKLQMARLSIFIKDVTLGSVLCKPENSSYYVFLLLLFPIPPPPLPTLTAFTFSAHISLCPL